MPTIGRRKNLRKTDFDTVSMVDIAEKVGVSIATISRVLNNSPKVHNETRSKVLQAMNQTNMARRSYMGRRHFNVGISLSYFSKGLLQDAFINECVAGILEVAFYNDFRIQILDILASRRADETYLQCLMDFELDGVIHVAPTEGRLQAINEIAGAGFKQVLVGARTSDIRVGWIDSENIESSKRAIKYLTSIGHRRIAVVAGPLEFRNHKERIEGYRLALKEAGIEPDPSLQVSTRQISTKGSCTVDLLTRNAGITAIYYTNSTLAIGGLKACQSMNIRVPDDLSIITFGDSSLPEHLEPPLAYIYQPAFEMGRMAAQQIIGEIKHRDNALNQVEIEPDFFINSSTGPCSPTKNS
jgi:DNA-binding LacI/PurR family transcriptional regulator